MRMRRFLIYVLSLIFLHREIVSVQILSKSKLEKCEKNSDSNKLNCTTKIIINMAVPSGSSGGEASIVAEIVEVEENSTNKMQTLRIPPVITINKSAAYAIYELTYIRDVAYKPEEFHVKTRKCEPDAGANVVKICERLRDEEGHIIEHTQPICCPCGPQRRVPSSCGNVFDKMMKGKPNTAHCLRFPGDWFHVFGIGQRSIGFSVKIEMKIGSKVSEVIIGPENRTATSNDNFLRVNLIGDFVGYSNIPTFEDFYLVIPRQGAPGQPNNLGSNFSMWMLLERVRFTLDGVECNKIGVNYEAFNGQPNFCSSPFWSCLHNQLWNFWEADQNRISRRQVPLYGVQGRYERINEHPNAGSHSFSIGVTEALNTNLLIELRADDIEYVFQRSPGKIISVTIPTFEALTQFGVATITAQNTGEVEASYSLTFDCSKGVSLMEEQFFIMKPKEISARSFKLYPTTDQAAKYICSAILKDSEFNEVDRAECQFSTTATILDNGSQITPFHPPKTGVNGFFESIKKIWKNLWESLVEFITGEACRRKCSGFFDFSCHIQYICMSWVVLFGLFLAIFPTVLVLLWLLHQKGFFDPLYDWWEDHFGFNDHRVEHIHRHSVGIGHFHIHSRKHYKARHHKHDSRLKRSSMHHEHRHNHGERDSDYYYHLHHVQKDRHKHRRVKSSSIRQQVHLDRRKNDDVGHHKHRRANETIERPLKMR
ncbi:Generative cell specific-1, HAP2-GCS1 [Corchorus capsularis]|uniref:Generative cell specific-1, HAP2-GCS1 n=1 Tax=Corchorus capsularis TaxID=210143 RepID=A0A1R3IA20_COCAP|nr:Generative cell specific-1, HAP2-GCS1 [Corchorus capsularis]